MVPRFGKAEKKQRISALRIHYLERLRGNLRKASPALAPEETSLGREAVALGLEIQEMAQIHQSALDTLKISKGKRELIALAEQFFAAATTPIVELNREAVRRTEDLHCLKMTLRERTSELNQAQRSLQHHVDKRQITEAAIKANGKHSSDLLKESQLVQDRLRLLTRQVLKDQERQRSKISHELQDDIAQNLLGINVRLLLLRTKAGKDSKGIANDLTKTQRLIAESRRSMRKATRRIAAP
jgi:signal transduction histidine kinase